MLQCGLAPPRALTHFDQIQRQFQRNQLNLHLRMLLQENGHRGSLILDASLCRSDKKTIRVRLPLRVAELLSPKWRMASTILNG